MVLTFWSSGQHGNKKKHNPWTFLVKPAVVKIFTQLDQKGPMTTKQLAQETGLSMTTISRHIQDLLDIELLRPAKIPEEEKKYKVERYYEPSFPIFGEEDRKRIREVQKAVGEKVASVILQNVDDFKTAFEKTAVSRKGWSFEDLCIKFYLLRPAYEGFLTKAGHLSDPPSRPGDNWWWVFGEERPQARVHSP